MNHPFAAARSTIDSPATPTSSLPTAKSKSIGELDDFPQELTEYIRELMLPAELQDASALASMGKLKSNFRVTIGALIKAITKGDLGLDKVDNTADKDKPLSELMIEALAKKMDADWKPTPQDIQGLDQLLDGYYSKEVGITIGDVKELTETLAGKASKNHGHAMGDISGLAQALSGKANTDHTHQLTSLEGWTEFIIGLNQTLANFATKTEVEQMIDERALVVGDWEWGSR